VGIFGSPQTNSTQFAGRLLKRCCGSLVAGCPVGTRRNPRLKNGAGTAAPELIQ
jgi:hypothetical protein